MTEASFRTEPCTSYTNKGDADRNHYNIPLVPWFMSNGQVGNHPSAFIPDTGYNTSFRNEDHGPDYIFNKTDPFWSEEGTLNHGFGVRQREINSFSKVFNYELSGGTGHWLPASMVRSISYYWEDVNGEEGAWAVKHIALILRNWRTDEKKTWASDYNNSDTSTGVKKIDSNFAYIRPLGPDWFVYGVIFNIARAGVYAGSKPEAKLTDFRLGYEYPDLDSSKHRMVIGKEMSWGNLKTALNAGQMKYEPAST